MSALVREGYCLEPFLVDQIRAEIEIKQHYTYKIYAPGSSIVGNVVIQAPHDILFSNMTISFVGTAVTRNYIQPEPVHATKPFMKLCMPIDEAAFPTGHGFKAGRVYTIPFHFVVPTELLMGSCRHGFKSPAVQEHHLRMPPSMGFCPGSDQSPEEARIVYSIVVVCTRLFVDLPVPVRLFTAHKTIRVLPTSPEDAPLDISPQSNLYVPSKTQSLWKTFFVAREGELTASASQPNAVMLSPDGTAASSSSMQLRLTYTSELPIPTPPRIKSVSGKIVAMTFFHVLPLTQLPNLETWKRHRDPPFQHTASLKLFDQQVEQLTWTTATGADGLQKQYTPGSPHVIKQDEAVTCQGSSEDASKLTRLEAEMTIAFNIPHGNQNFFLPSFDSCLISRTYFLRLSISLGAAHTSVVLKLPLQIGVEGASPRHSCANVSGREAECQLDWGRGQALNEPGYHHLPEYSLVL